MAPRGALALYRRSLCTSQRLNDRCSRCNLSTAGSQLEQELTENRRTSLSKNDSSASDRRSLPQDHDQPKRQPMRPRGKQSQHSSANRQSRPPATPKFIISPEARTHYQADGTFRTTPENYEWFRRTGIIPDNNDKWYMRGLDKADSKYLAFQAAFSRNYFIDPVHTPYFAPHLEPRVVALRAEYERKLSKPLWVYAGCYTDDRVVVRTMAKRKLVGHMYEASQILQKEGIHIRGTVHFSIWSAIKVLTLAKDKLLKRFVDALRHEASQQIQPERSEKEGGAKPVPRVADFIAENVEDVSKPAPQGQRTRVQRDNAWRTETVQSRVKTKPAGDRFSAQDEGRTDQLCESQKKELEFEPMNRILKAQQNRQRSRADLWADEAKATTARRGQRVALTKNTETPQPSSAGRSRPAEGIDS